MHGERILIAEDDESISGLLRELLEQSGFYTDAAFSGTEALLVFSRQSYQLVLLDLMLPGLPGEEVLRRIRQTSDVPIIGLSAKDSRESKVGLLRDGADDYITKPFDNEELLARIDALLRREHKGKREGGVYQVKDLVLDTAAFSAALEGQRLALTKREYLILELLMHDPNRVFTKNQIYESVWNQPFIGEDNAVNVHISNIRQKLAKINPRVQYIQTVWGIGFKMNR